MSAPDLDALAADLVGRAAPGEGLEVAVSRSTSTTVRAHGGDVESFTSAESFGVGIRVVVEGRVGFAHAGSFDEDVVADALAEARDNATFAESDPWAGLAEPDGVPAAVIDPWSPALAAVSADRKIALALDLERATRAADPRIRGVRVATYGDSAAEWAIASTTGIRATSRATTAFLSVQALADDGASTHSGYGVDLGRDPDALRPDRVAAEAVREATRLIGAAPVPSARVTVILDARRAATLLGIVAATLCGDAVTRGRSPFADRLGEVVASPLLGLFDDATDERSPGAEAVDGEGLASRRTALLEGGCLRAFLHNSSTARRAGITSTGSAIRGARTLPGVGARALQVVPGDGDLDEVLARVGDGFLVQSMHGLHSGVNPVSGDFSVGADGLLVRGGALAEPVREVTIASTLQRLLTDVVAVGGALEWQPSGTGSVPLAIADVALSGR